MKSKYNIRKRNKIKKQLAALRALIDSTSDPIESRIAYAMETSVIWAASKTVGWPSLVEEAKINARLLRQEIGGKQ